MSNLEIIITGKNESSQAFASLKQDTAEVEKGLASAGKTGSGFFSGMLQTAGGFLAANVLGNIAGQLTGFVTDGIAAAQDTAKLMAQTETIIKNTGGAAGMSAQQVSDLATSLSDAAGKSLFGDDQIQGAENVLLKYKELKGIIPGVTTLAVDMAQSLGKDPAAAAEFLGRALQKPFDATAKLAKEGVVLTDSQKATLEAFKKTGDTAGAQAFLMEQLNATYKGSAAAAAGASGGMVQFKARLGEAGESIGAALLPLLNKMAGILNDTVAPAIEALAAWLGDNLPKAIDKVSGFWTNTLQPALAKVWAFLQSALIPIIDELTKWLRDELPPAIAQLADYWTNTLQPALQKIWVFIQANVIPILDTLVKVAFAVLKEDIKILAALWVNVLWPALQKVWAFISENVIPILAKAVVWLKDNLPPAIKYLSDLWNNTLLPALTATWQFIDTKVLPVLKAVGDVINAVLVVAFRLIVGTITTTVIPALERMWAYFDANILPVLKKVGDTITTVAGPALTALGGLIAPIIGYFSDLSTNISGVIGWLESLAAKIASIKIPSWAGGSGGSSGGSTPPGNATGTSNFKGGLTMVGEMGPELVRLPKGSQISNASDTRAALSDGGQMNVVVSFDGRGADLLRQMIRVEVTKIMGNSGNLAYNRIRAGG